ncbi:S41 family peptidase [Neptunitalea lumnitzerae]|nr:S41 family peptidase [Neptunitalea sp. Y10]
MKNLLGVILLLLLFSFHLQAQSFKTSQDSIQYFYKNLFETMKKGYLFKENVDWEEVALAINENCKQYYSFEESLEEVSNVFDLTNADHSKLFYNNQVFSGNFEGPTQDDFTEQWVRKYKTTPAFEVTVLDDKYGYILVPAMRSEKKLNKQAQRMYDEIYKIKSSHTLQGWIIDLRFNTGGDIWPMLLPLYDFLGDTKVWGTLDFNKKLVSEVTLEEGKYKANAKKIASIKPKGELLDNVKVAVITNMATGSSGEVTALSFKGRSHTIFIGDKTYGKTTTNVGASLPFGAYMTLTVGYDCDRNGTYYEQISPDVTVKKQDNFDNLLLDGNIQEAIKFINAH